MRSSGQRGRSLGRLALGLALIGCLPGITGAQGAEALPRLAETQVGGGRSLCNGEVVREIVTYSAAPTVARAHRIPVIGTIARSTHVTTRPEIVRGFLQLEEGDRCTELARAESERVLRAQPFLADADIEVVPVDGGVRLDVHTIDEASLVVGARVRSGAPYLGTLRLGNSNVAGAGVHLRGEWRDGRANRDGGMVQLTDHQFMGEPFELRLRARRAPLGGDLAAALTRPFLTGLQRHAWRAGASRSADWLGLEHPDSATHAIRVEREHADAGIMARIGPPVRMGLLGFLLSYEREAVGDALHAFNEDGTPFIAGPFATPSSYRSTRLNALLGFRNLSFTRVEGFDALTARQDIPTGFQAGIVVGQGLDAPPAGASRELFLASDMYLGFGTPRRATRLQLRAQGVRDGERRWGRTVATGRLAHQRKLMKHQLLELSADWAATWFTGSPIQLLLGAENGGVRGYDDSRSGGSQRARVTAEHRVTIPDVEHVGDLGFAAFVDAGRVWRGDAPFGVTTPVRRAVGVSILAAVPSRSARGWRFDVALPLDGPGAYRVDFGLSRGDRVSVFWREPADLAALRGASVPGSVFAWP